VRGRGTLQQIKIDWNIPDPKGKDIEDYRRTLKIIKGKVAELLGEV
jgi:protein-tyrosine-phosphatase